MKHRIFPLVAAAVAVRPALALAVSYPAIKPKNVKADPAAQGFFAWIVDNFPWVLLGIAALCFVLAAFRAGKRRRESGARAAKIRELEALHRKSASSEEWESFRHHQFVQKQRSLMTDSLRYDILKRDGYRCKICGATAADGVKLHVDHIIPVSKGGRTEPGNLQTLCERCNLGKSNKL